MKTCVITKAGVVHCRKIKKNVFIRAVVVTCIYWAENVKGPGTSETIDVLIFPLFFKVFLMLYSTINTR